MAEASNRRGDGRLRIALAGILVVAVVSWLIFKLYEPLIVGPFGWAAMPEGDFPVTTRTSGALPQAATRADAWVAEARRQIGAPAVSAAVSVGGEVVWAGAAGYADLEREIAAHPETVFRIGSTSKAVTSVAMGTLLDKDAVDLDAPVSSYMPGLAEPLATVTTRQAMSHTAGVRDYGTCLCFPVLEYFNRKHYETQRDSLRPFERDELLFPPGDGFSYSSYGYNVVGAVIESVTGERFADFLDATRDLLLPPGDAPPFYGLGWRYQVETEFLDGTTPRIHHHGTALGSTSHFTVYPEYGMVVSLMMNAGQLPGRGLEPHAHALAEIFAAELDSGVPTAR
jgi:CubicO group peptidase (beta-lactamase class C family)